MISLTKAEEQIMQVLWTLERAFIKEVIDELPEPKPAYNTVSTIVRILEKKGVVGYTAFGKTHQYYPLVSKKEYSKYQVSGLVKNYFEGSLHQLVSHFSQHKKIDITELDETIKLLQTLKNKNK